MVCVYSYKSSLDNVTPGISIVSCLKFVRLNALFVRLNAPFVTVNARNWCSQNIPKSVCKTKCTSSLFKFRKSAFTFAIHQNGCHRGKEGSISWGMIFSCFSRKKTAPAPRNIRGERKNSKSPDAGAAIRLPFFSGFGSAVLNHGGIGYDHEVSAVLFRNPVRIESSGDRWRKRWRGRNRERWMSRPWCQQSLEFYMTGGKYDA